MLKCLPAGLCSWDYRISEGALGDAMLRFNWMSEQGSIAVNHVEYSVVKHGVWSGRWTLESGGSVVAEAVKPSALFRAFDVSGFREQFQLKAASPFTRTFQLIQAGNVIGSIVPAHAFTRRATVEVSTHAHEVLQLFSFWLVALLWKRAQENNRSNATMHG